MNNDTLLLVGEIDGHRSDFATLMSMMNYVRVTTIDAIEDITIEELDFLHTEEGNTIGMLLFHVAAVETAYQIETFEKRDFTEEELAKWEAALVLGEKGREQIKGNDVNFYLDLLEQVRTKTFAEFQNLSDDWLFEKSEMWGTIATNYFQWFHVFEDELNHRGQIRLIRNLYKNK